MAMDPSEFFPYEIFTKILQFASYGVPDGPLHFLTTSSRWMNTILETADIWTYIEVDNSVDVSRRVSVFLHLSRERPIDVQVAVILDSTEVLQLVLQEFPRIRALMITSESPSFALSQVATPTLGFLGTSANLELPQVEEISIRKYDKLPTVLLAACPKLRVIHGARIQKEDMAVISNSIRELEFVFSGPEELQAISQRTFTSLKLSNDNKNWGDAVDYCPRLWETNKNHLEHFYITTRRVHLFLNEFLRTPPVRLLSLAIELPLDMVKYLFSSIQFFPELRSLTVISLISNWPHYSWPIPPPASSYPLLRHFAIVDRTRDANRSNLREISQHFAGNASLRGIDKVKLSLRGTFVELSLLTPLLESIPSARILEVSFKTHTDRQYLDKSTIDLKRIAMPNLEIMDVDSIDCLRLIHTPSLLELKVHGSTLDEDPLVLEKDFGSSLRKIEVDWDSIRKLQETTPPEIEQQRWDGIMEIDWRTWSIPCETFTVALRSLTTITLPLPEGGTTYRDIPINSLCYILLRSKDACPRLQTIASPSFPLWDLLFTTLQYRSRDVNVARITTIRFSCLPVVSLLRCLVGLLKGQTPEAPTTADSLIRKRLDMEKRMACTYCLCAGYTLCLHDSNKIQESDYEDENNVHEGINARIGNRENDSLHLLNPEYLAQSLIVEWEKVLGDEIPRNLEYGPACYRHDDTTLMTINTFTPIGE